MLDQASPTLQPDVLGRLLDAILAGDDVTLFIRNDDGRVLLDTAAERLSAMRCRALRAVETAADGLSLSTLMAQVVGQPVPNAQPKAQYDEFLRRSFQALTALDNTCDRIVLLVSDANTLQPAAIRYIQLACRAGTSLQLVLAGKRGFLDLLNAHEFAHLRERLATGPIITPAPPRPAVAPVAPVASVPPRPIYDASPAPAPERVAPERVAPERVAPERVAPEQLAPEQAAWLPSRPVLSSSSDASNRKRLTALAGIGLGVATCVALTIWAGGGSKPATAPSQQAALVVESLAVPDKAVAELPQVPPAPAAVPAPVAQQPPAPALEAPAPAQEARAPAQEAPAPAQEANAPAVSPPTAPSVVAPPSPVTSPAKSVNRKSTLAQQRAAAARAPVLNAGNVAAWEDPYPPPPHDWRPAPQQAMTDPPDEPKSYIGTYTTDANGIRAFRSSR